MEVEQRELNRGRSRKLPEGGLSRATAPPSTLSPHRRWLSASHDGDDRLGFRLAAVRSVFRGWVFRRPQNRPWAMLATMSPDGRAHGDPPRGRVMRRARKH